MIRNWWIETQVDGAATVKKTGPKSEIGGFITTILQRNGGEHTVAAVLSGFADRHGRLFLTIRVNNKEDEMPIVATFDTE